MQEKAGADILLIEDEAEIRELMSGVLKASGYTVMEAVDGEEAIAKYLDHPGTIRLVLTDLSLPKINGERVLETIRKADPRARVVVCSGYLDEKKKSELHLLGATEMLDKPYSISRVLEVVERVMDTP